MTVTRSNLIFNGEAKVTVFVERADIVAVLSGALTRDIAPASSIELNAEDSYDEDQQDLTGTEAGLTYHWSFQQRLPTINADGCPGISYSRTGQPKLIINYLIQGTTSVFTVEVVHTITKKKDSTSAASSYASAVRNFFTFLR